MDDVRRRQLGKSRNQYSQDDGYYEEDERTNDDIDLEDDIRDPRQDVHTTQDLEDYDEGIDEDVDSPNNREPQKQDTHHAQERERKPSPQLDSDTNSKKLEEDSKTAQIQEKITKFNDGHDDSDTEIQEPESAHGESHDTPNILDSFNKKTVAKDKNDKSVNSTAVGELSRKVHNYSSWISKPLLYSGLTALTIGFVGVIFPPLALAFPIALGLLSGAGGSEIISRVAKRAYDQDMKPKSPIKNKKSHKASSKDKDVSVPQNAFQVQPTIEPSTTTHNHVESLERRRQQDQLLIKDR